MFIDRIVQIGDPINIPNAYARNLDHLIANNARWAHPYARDNAVEMFSVMRLVNR